MFDPTGTPAALATEGELHSCMGPVQPSGGLTPAHQDRPREPTQVCTLTATLQWNLFTVEPLYSGQHQDAAGCPVKRGSLIQKYICTQLYMVGTADSVLIREVSLIQSVLY